MRGVPALVWRATAEVGYDVITTYPAQHPTPPPVASTIMASGTVSITMGAVMIVTGAVRRRRRLSDDR